MKKLLLCGFLATVLFGCGEDAEQVSHVAVKLTAGPAWDSANTKQIVAGGDCHIDGINDLQGEGPESHTVSRKGSGVKVVGWAAVSVADGIGGADIALALKPKVGDGARMFAATTSVMRPDVTAYFKKDGLDKTGFSAVVDLSSVKVDTYTLEVIQHKGESVLRCPVDATLVVVD